MQTEQLLKQLKAKEKYNAFDGYFAYTPEEHAAILSLLSTPPAEGSDEEDIQLTAKQFFVKYSFQDAQEQIENDNLNERVARLMESYAGLHSRHKAQQLSQQQQGKEELDLSAISKPSLKALQEIGKIQELISQLVFEDVHEDIVEYLLKPVEHVLTYNGVNLPF